MDILTLIKVLVWLIANIRRQLLLSYYLQIKEYRLDRFFIFAKSRDGITRLELPQLVLKLIILISPFTNLIFISLTYELFQTLNNLLSHQLRRPQISIRGRNFLFTSFIFIIPAAFLLYTNPTPRLFLHLDLFSYIIPAIALFWTQLRFNQILTRETDLATSKLQETKPQIIAITGSYAKSSTKHLLQSVLSSHLNCLATPASHNTPFGIIRTINSSLTKNTGYFIVEMGAYKKNEIANLVKITPPNLSLITGITPQHLELFGSFQNLLQAKYEIAQKLNPRQPLFINTSHPSTKPLVLQAKKENKNLITYALDDKADYSGQIISRSPNQTKFSLQTPQKKYRYVTPVVLSHLIENLIGALAVAHYLKIPHTKLKKTIANLQTNTFGLNVKNLSPKITLLDDSHNSNPQGFSSALKHLYTHKTFKIVVTSGIIELGNHSNKIHQKLGKKLQKADLVLLTNPQFVSSLKKGLAEHAYKLRVINGKNIKICLNQIKKPATILMEGRLPVNIKKSFLCLK